MVRQPPPRFGPKKQKVVSEVRSPHGTRVLKRIVCSRCGKSDTLAFVPKAGEAVLCRSCAEETQSAVSEGELQSADRYVACKDCGKRFPLAKRPQPLFIPRGLEDVAEQLSDKGSTELCADCRKKHGIERRNLAKKPGGVHPLVVKAKRPRE